MIDIQVIKNFFETKKWFILFLFVFVLIHIPALDFPYHQDEYKWAEYVNPELSPPGGIPHPPIGEFVYSNFGGLIGYDNLRVVPFVFGLLNLILLFILGNIIFDRRTATWIVFIFTISFYSLLASLMVDTDGAILVSSFLLLAIFYYKWKENEFVFKSKWFTLAFTALIIGFLTKESFVLPISAFALDFALEKRIFEDRKKFFKYFLGGVVGVIVLISILFLSKFIFPFFRIEWFLAFLPRFFNFVDRGWFQTFIQFAKALMYLSPLLIAPFFLIDKKIVKKTRPFLFFIAIGLTFYLLLFDFSVGAIDRYLQFLIVPLSLISGAIISKILKNTEFKINSKKIFAVLVIGILVFSTQFLNQIVPSLHPKSLWLSRILGFKWNFLFPFTGGSGPAGFYVSFLFISLMWILSTLIMIFTIRYLNFKKAAIISILILGILYNGVFIEEYLFGNINGSPPKLFAEAKDFITDNKDIEKVVVYNDIGGYDIRRLGIYERRLYAAPEFEEGYRDFFKTFDGHVLYIDIPRIQQNSFYHNYLLSCQSIYEENDKYINARILKCHKQE